MVQIIPNESGVIYAFHSGDHRYRYVGKTSGRLRTRVSQHFSAARAGVKRHVYNWMRKTGVDRVCVEVLDRCADPGMLIELEVCWIARLRGEGFDLTNGTDGGDGASGYKHTAETIEKVRLANAGRMRSPETRARMSAAKMGNNPSAETRMKISESKKGQILSRKNWQKMHDAHSGMVLSESDVVEILQLMAEGHRNIGLARKYGVAANTMSEIRRGNLWKQIPRPEGVKARKYKPRKGNSNDSVT